MPKRLPITLRDRLKIKQLYAQGATASDIASSLRELNLTALQIQNIICRDGLAKQKAELQAIRAESIEQVFAEARASAAGDARAFLQAVAKGLQIDAKKLEDGWGDLVLNGAADASSLMRAKKLLLERGFEFYGLNAEPAETTKTDLLAAIICRPMGPKSTALVNVTPPIKPSDAEIYGKYGSGAVQVERSDSDDITDGDENDELNFV